MSMAIYEWAKQPLSKDLFELADVEVVAIHRFATSDAPALWVYKVTDRYRDHHEFRGGDIDVVRGKVMEFVLWQMHEGS